VARSLRPVPPYGVTLPHQVGLPHGDRFLHRKGSDRLWLILRSRSGTPRVAFCIDVVIGGQMLLRAVALDMLVLQPILRGAASFE